MGFTLLHFVKLEKSEFLFICKFHDLADALGSSLQFLIWEGAAVELFLQRGFLCRQILYFLFKLFHLLLFLEGQLAFLCCLFLYCLFLRL